MVDPFSNPFLFTSHLSIRILRTRTRARKWCIKLSRRGIELQIPEHLYKIAETKGVQCAQYIAHREKRPAFLMRRDGKYA